VISRPATPGGCDLTKAGAHQYAADPATEILCFGYLVAGADHSWAPSGPRDPLARLADPAATFARFGGFEPAVCAAQPARQRAGHELAKRSSGALSINQRSSDLSH
jgi:hypothetical protein